MDEKLFISENQRYILLYASANKEQNYNAKTQKDKEYISVKPCLHSQSSQLHSQVRLIINKRIINISNVRDCIPSTTTTMQEV